MYIVDFFSIYIYSERVKGVPYKKKEEATAFSNINVISELSAALDWSQSELTRTLN